MITYRLVPESEWKAAVEAIEALAKALRRAGTVIMPGEEEASKPAIPERGAPPKEIVKHRIGLARQVIDRVNAGGQKHRPKVFDREGPRIADFVDALTNDSFTVPNIIERVSKYVALKDGRREAGSQIRTAIRADSRFERRSDGTYYKKNEAASEIQPR